MAMTQIPRDFLELLKLLNQHGVKYLVVGGYAVVLHGHNRMTGDLDLFIELSPTNAEAFCAAYHEFGLGRGEVTAADFLEEGKMIRAGFEPMRLEVLNRISGVTFEECFPHRVEIEVEGVPVNFIGRDHLIANKRASGRDKDLLDVKKLTKGATKGRSRRKKSD